VPKSVDDKGVLEETRHYRPKGAEKHSDMTQNGTFWHRKQKVPFASGREIG